MEINTTPFSDVYDSFLSKITEDMYMELTKEDTYRMLEELLISSLPKFEFPRFNIFDYERGKTYTKTITKVDEETGETIEEVTNEYDIGYFHVKLSLEEINIIATYMILM